MLLFGAAGIARCQTFAHACQNGAKIAKLTETATVVTPEIEAAQAEGEKTLVKIVDPSFGEWHMIGPFTGGDVNKVFETAFGPENGLDVSVEVAGKKWQKRTDFPDGKVHALPSDGNAAWYLYRTIKAPQATQLAVSLGSDDGMEPPAFPSHRPGPV